PDRRMAGERQLSPRRENAQAVVGPLVRRRADERRLGQVRPRRDRLHLLARHGVAIEHDCDRVALEWHGGEHVHLLEGKGLHPELLLWGWSTRPIERRASRRRSASRPACRTPTV